MITVDDRKFRWTVSPNDGYCVFVAEEENLKRGFKTAEISENITRFQFLTLALSAR
ncbi:MAG: hypothetical protein HC880_22090 [Bacteroidia bacterium]|nr:hypothetical protein [Bacteroidia bacterium]